MSELLEAEEERYRASHPRSLALAGQAAKSFLNGVPMSWMSHWATPFPLFMERAKGARLWDVDGNEYIDFCLGDTGAMAGHSPPATAEAIARRAAIGHHGNPADGGRDRGGRRTDPPLRAPDVADRDDRDRRKSLRPPARAAADRQAQGARVQLVLPRHGRRDSRRIGLRRSRGSPAGVVGPTQPAATPPASSSSTTSTRWSESSHTGTWRASSPSPR